MVNQSPLPPVRKPPPLSHRRSLLSRYCVMALRMKMKECSHRPSALMSRIVATREDVRRCSGDTPDVAIPPHVHHSKHTDVAIPPHFHHSKLPKQHKSFIYDCTSLSRPSLSQQRRFEGQYEWGNPKWHLENG